MKEIIKIEELKRQFTMGTETVHALKGISFDIKEGEFVTIMGSSGSGKSTMLNILGCLDQPTSGLYKIDGINVKDLSRNELATIRNEKIGFIFQSYNLLARTSAIELANKCGNVFNSNFICGLCGYRYLFWMVSCKKSISLRSNNSVTLRIINYVQK